MVPRGDRSSARPVKHQPPSRQSLGEWNAYAAAGETHEERKRRLESAPPELQPQILNHLKTVHALRKKSRGRRRHDEIKARLG